MLRPDYEVEVEIIITRILMHTLGNIVDRSEQQQKREKNGLWENNNFSLFRSISFFMKWAYFFRKFLLNLVSVQSQR